jgi:MFS family permease
VTVHSDARHDEPSPAGRDRVRRRTLVVLSAAQVVGGIGVGAALAVGALAAEEISGTARWAGLATTMITLGAAAFALPLAAAADRRGRPLGQSLGWFIAAAGGAVVLAAVTLAHFPLFLAGMVLFGSGTATNLQSRYAAAGPAPLRGQVRRPTIGRRAVILRHL